MFGRDRRERDLEREIRADIELEAEEQAARGLPPANARAAAQRAFGNAAIYMEEVREMWGWTSLERLGQDLKYAARMFARNRLFVADHGDDTAVVVGVHLMREDVDTLDLHSLHDGFDLGLIVAFGKVGYALD